MLLYHATEAALCHQLNFASKQVRYSITNGDFHRENSIPPTSTTEKRKEKIVLKSQRGKNTSLEPIIWLKSSCWDIKSGWDVSQNNMGFFHRKNTSLNKVYEERRTWQIPLCWRKKWRNWVPTWERWPWSGVQHSPWSLRMRSSDIFPALHSHWPGTRQQKRVIQAVQKRRATTAKTQVFTFATAQNKVKLIALLWGDTPKVFWRNVTRNICSEIDIHYLWLLVFSKWRFTRVTGGSWRRTERKILESTKTL